MPFYKCLAEHFIEAVLLTNRVECCATALSAAPGLVYQEGFNPEMALVANCNFNTRASTLFFYAS